MDILLINRKLKDIYGADLLGQPIFRIVWSEDLIEKRFSTFRDYVPGTNILLREVTEVRELKKYRDYKPQYVLEKLMVNHHGTEILDSDSLSPSNAVYEPLWMFKHEDKGKPKQPVWRAVELLLSWIMNPKKLSPSDMKDSEIKQYEEDERIMMEMLEIQADEFGQSLLGSKIKDGDAVVLSNTDYLVKE